MQEEIRRASQAAADPTSFPLITYLWVLFMAAWGGVVRVLREHQIESKTWGEALRIFVTELTISCFVGVVTFYLCQLAEFKPLYTAILTSISGYMGGRSLAMMEAFYKAFIRSRTHGL